MPTTGEDTAVDVGMSPIPDDPGPSSVTANHDISFLRQQSRWRRVLRTALPLQVVLFDELLLGFA